MIKKGFFGINLRDFCDQKIHKRTYFCYDENNDKVCNILLKCILLRNKQEFFNQKQQKLINIIKK